MKVSGSQKTPALALSSATLQRLRTTSESFLTLRRERNDFLNDDFQKI